MRKCLTSDSYRFIMTSQRLNAPTQKIALKPLKINLSCSKEQLSVLLLFSFEKLIATLENSMRKSLITLISG